MPIFFSFHPLKFLFIDYKSKITTVDADLNSIFKFERLDTLRSVEFIQDLISVEMYLLLLKYYQNNLLWQKSWNPMIVEATGNVLWLVTTVP